MVLTGYVALMDMVRWAFELAEEKLADSLPRRWAHSRGVARQARILAPLAGEDASLLEAAAVAHDIGYAPDLVRSGFHPLDGAVFLAEQGAPRRLINLVAHHTFAALEAKLRGLSSELAVFADEEGPIRDGLWYCDLTTSPDGHELAAQVRIAEIKRRYGPQDLVTRFITEGTPELLAAVDRTRQRLGAFSAGETQENV
jgi:hypothetical protein